jgi:DNA polymerase III subunit gamma/tau
MVFYRKYRPQTIDDLDSESVRETLVAVLQKDVPHAFLFTGPKGLGKTSTARIVAKVVNCTTDKSKRKNGIEPCDRCDACVSIKNGTNIDVLEIDAASNRGIDEIRELKEKIRLSPVGAKRKVYIIDEVHMLTTEAFNALLKTLEEPPDHAMFILCTTESHKVPETIVSRCFQILFKPATEKELVRSFKRIIEGEKLSIDDKTLQYIAQLSDRGFRDGAKVLEEVSLLAKKGEKIDKALLEKTFKTSMLTQGVLSLLAFLKDRNVKPSLEMIKTLYDEGVDIKYFIAQVVMELHEILLHNELGEANKTMYGSLKFTNSEVITLVTLFSQAYQDMKTAVIPQLPLELAIIEWCELSQVSSKEKAGSSSVEPQKSYVAEDTEVSVSSLRKQVGTMKKLKALYGTPTTKNTTPTEEVTITTTTVELMHTSADGTVTKEWLEAFWRNLITEMKKYNHTVAGVLRGCTVKSYADQKLVIQTAYKFHKERLDDMKNHESLVKISKLLTGKDVAITVELKK